MLNAKFNGSDDLDRIRSLEDSVRRLRRTIRFLGVAATLGISAIVCLAGAVTPTEGLVARVQRLEKISPEPDTLVCKRLYVISEPSKFDDPDIQRLLTNSLQGEETFVLVSSPTEEGKSENRYVKLAASRANAHLRIEYNHPGSYQDGVYDVIATRARAEVMKSPAPNQVRGPIEWSSEHLELDPQSSPQQ